MKRYCLDCKAYYSPNVQPGGSMPKGYKVCPKCQSTKTEPKKTPKFVGTTCKARDFEWWNKLVRNDNANNPRDLVRFIGQAAGQVSYREAREFG